MKTCSKCRIHKELYEFGKDSPRKDGLSYMCKPCKNEFSSKWRKNNSEKASKSGKKYQKKNRKYLSKYRLNLRKNNPKSRLIESIRNRVLNGLKRNKIKKSYKTVDYLGCSFEYLKKHLEEQFTPDINWDNFGSFWHIDHIVPLSFCNDNDIEFMKILTHYSNLRPLKKEENFKKGNKIDLTLANSYGIIIPEAYLNTLSKE